MRTKGCHLAAGIRRMESQTLPLPRVLSMGALSGKRWDRRNDLTNECRSLIRLLSYTIDSLCEGNEYSEKNIRNIRSLITSLSSLKKVAEEHESMILDAPAMDFVDDASGNRYFAVRHCELERFSEK